MDSIVITNPPASAPVLPSDCTLICTLPLDRERFLEGLAPGSGSDFVRCFAAEHRLDSADELWGRYQPYSRLARLVVDRVSALGVQVKEDATFGDFVRSLSDRSVTTLVAHWRSALFRVEDLVVRRGDAEDTRVVDRSNAELEQAAKHQVEQDAVSLLAKLTVEQYAFHRKRREIEQRHPGDFTGGASVEFSTGFETIERIVTAIPSSYCGTLDLGVCQSVLLGEEISRKCPGSLIIKAADLTTLDFRLALYHQTIEILSREPQPYEAAVVAIRKELVK